MSGLRACTSLKLAPPLPGGGVPFGSHVGRGASMAEVALRNGGVALVDDEDFARVSQWVWSAQPIHKMPGALCARGSVRDALGRVAPVSMHRFILDAPNGLTVDHIDHDCLNNRRSNLRLATVGENNRNRRTRRGASGFRGVIWDQQRWCAAIYHEGRRINIGRFANLEDAARARDKRARELHGEFAILNFPEAA